MKLKSLKLIATVGLIVGGLESCSKKSDDSTSSDADTAAAAAGGSGVASPVGSLSVSSMASLPNLEEMVQSSAATSLRLAVTGEPIAFSSITADNISEYLTGSVDALVAEIAVSRASHDWANVKALGDTFRQGGEKCHIMQDAARQLSVLSENTSDACMMGRIDKEGAGILKYKSGEEVADGTVFAAADTDKVRVIMAGKDKKIVAQIQGKDTETGVYQVVLTFCRADGSSDNATKFRIDNNASKMTFGMSHSGTHVDQSGKSATRAGSGELTGYLKLAEDGTSYTFDTEKARTMTISDKGESAAESHAFNASLEISGDVLTSKMVGQNSFTDKDGNASTGNNHSGASVRFSGTKASDVVIYEGAGVHKGAFTKGTEAAIEHTDVVGFEYDETAAPKYTSIDTSDYLDTVNAFDFDTDEILSLSAPAAPDSSLNDSANCGLTPDSVYTIVPNKAMEEAQTSCQSHFDHADQICNKLQEEEHKIWDAVKAAPPAAQ